MKKIKNLYKFFILLLVVVACDEELRDISFADSIALPTNISATYDITQDNTGTVTITPSAEGAVSYVVTLGDSSDPVTLSNGENVQHVYAEGTYNITIVASNLKGGTAEATQQLIVSFTAPQNLVVVIENDAAISKKVNITANADFAAMFDFDSGEAGVTQPVVSGNIGETISYQYTTPGIYSVKVVAKGAAIETTEYAADFEVTEILAPIASAEAPPARNAEDVVAINADGYTNINADLLPDWGQSQFGSSFMEFDLNGDKMLQYVNLSYQGIAFDGDIQDVSSMEYLHIDVWTPNLDKMEISVINTTDEKPVWKDLTANEWTSLDIPLSEFTDQGLTLDQVRQLKFASEGPWPKESIVFVDNIYFYKAPTTFPKVFDDFEGNGTITTWKGDAAGVDPAFANPFKDANNGSDTVLKYTDDGGQYANITFDVNPNFNFAEKQSFTVKVYVPSSSVTGTSPNQVSLKLQDGTVAQPWVTQSEIIKPIQLDTWQTLTFDFATDQVLGSPNPMSRSDFNRVLFQVNGENNNDNVVAYFDDVAWADDLFVGPLPKDDFEGNGNITTWAGDAAGLDINFANPFKNSDNDSDTVLEYTDDGGQYANIRFDADGNFNMEKHTFSLKIYVPSSSVTGTAPNQISLKLQDGTIGQPWTSQTEIIKAIQLDTWQTVTFDFKNDTTAGTADPLNRTDFNRVILQVNGENNNDNVKAYIDDFKYQ